MAARIFIMGYEMRGDGGVAFDVEVRREVEDEEGNKSFVPVGHGHRTVVIDAAAMNVIAGKSWSDGRKLQEIAALIRADVQTWRVVEAEDAVNWFATICPEISREHPIDIPLRV